MKRGKKYLDASSKIEKGKAYLWNKEYSKALEMFDMVDDILDLKHNNKIIVRMSVNPEEIINRVEFGTSRLQGRIEAINKLKESGYKDGILIAPEQMVENSKELYPD